MGYCFSSMKYIHDITKWKRITDITFKLIFVNMTCITLVLGLVSTFRWPKPINFCNKILLSKYISGMCEMLWFHKITLHYYFSDLFLSIINIKVSLCATTTLHIEKLHGLHVLELYRKCLCLEYSFMTRKKYVYNIWNDIIQYISVHWLNLAFKTNWLCFILACFFNFTNSFMQNPIKMSAQCLYPETAKMNFT